MDMGMDGNASFDNNEEQPIENDPDMMGNEPEMGADAFNDDNDDNNSDVSKDPVKKVESLIGQASSLIRKHLNSDGINKHEDKKKEVLGMLTSAIVDGMSTEERNEIIDYLSDKLQNNENDNTDNNQEDGEINTNDELSITEPNDEQSITEPNDELTENFIRHLVEKLL